MRKTVLLLSFFLSACTGSSPDSHYFTLSPVPPQDQPRPGRPALHVTAFHLPQLYDRPQMVFRTGAQSVDIDETDRWAEPLDRMAARILAQDLAPRRPQPSGVEVTLQVTIDDFIADRTGNAHLSGSWKAGGKAGAFDLTAESGGASPDQAAAALSTLLGRLASEIDRGN
jgi:uncharacterized lipoprotein YmbA